MSINKVNQTTGELSQAAGSVVTAVYSDAPVGSIVPFGGTTFPTGWLLCDGTEVLRADYPDLFAVIGTSFGTPSADTKFKLPDLRGEFLRGAGTNSHSDQGDGGAVGEHQDGTEIPGVYANNYGKLGIFPANNSTTEMNVIADKMDSTTADAVAYMETLDLQKGATGDHAALYTARPTNTSVNFIIKAVKTALPTDFTEEIDDVQDQVDGINDALDDIVDIYGCKNMLAQNGWTTHTDNDITITKNSDGSITVNGTNSSTTDSVYFVISDLMTPPSGDYILSSGSTNAKVGVFANCQTAAGVYVKTLAIAFETEEAITVDYSNYTNIKYGVAIRPNVTIDNLVIYPMLRRASIEDDAYVPHTMTNKELTDVSSTSVSLNSTYVNSGQVTYQKIGKLIIVDIANLSVTSSADQNSVLCTLPKPNSRSVTDTKVRSCLWSTGGRSLGNACLFEVNASNGYATLGGYLPTATSESVYGQIVYIMD